MPLWLQILAGMAGSVALLWLVLLAVLWVQARKTGRAVDWDAIAKLVPDVGVLVDRLSSDPTVPWRVRWWLGVLLVYLALPFDLIPDFIPVLGYADDAIIAASALRFAVRHAGMDAVRHNWPGSDEGLRALLGLTRAG